MAVKLVIDSASDISEIEAEKLGIIMVPMEVRFGETEYLDGVNILPKEFFEKLIESDDLPKTSQINPFKFEEVFKKIVDDGDEVVAITISSKLSGTYQSAKQAAKKFEGKVFVVDSLNASLGERLLCQYAERLLKAGMSAKEIASKLDADKKKINVLAVLDTLKYLKKGGRISPLVAFTGEMLSIKPVVAIIEGEVKLVGKARGSKKSNNLLNELVAKKGGVDFDMPYLTAWSGLDKSMLTKYIEDSGNLWKDKTENIPSFMIGCTIGTHIGPGAIGVAFFEK